MASLQNETKSTENELFIGYSDELLIFGSVACIVFIVVGVPGNLLTIVALSRGKQTRNSTAIFIINLSLSDLLFGCFNLPLAASTFMQRAWVHSDLLCRFFPLIRYGLLAVSLFTISLITINRYIIIGHPRHYPRIYQRRYLALMLAGTWIMAFSIMIPTWRGVWGKFGLDIEIGSCSILPDENGRSPKEFLFIIAFLVPIVCIVICYARIFYLVRKAAVRMRDPPQKNISFRSENNQPSKTNDIKIQSKATKVEKDSKDKSIKPFDIDEICFIDDDSSSPQSVKSTTQVLKKKEADATTDAIQIIEKNSIASSTIIKTSFTRFKPRKSHYASMGASNSNASSIYPGKMSSKDKRLLKMILLIFVLFVICYLPITITKTWKSVTNIQVFNICSYVLVYLTTCINPLIYVLMSLEYRRAYLSLLKCESEKQIKLRNQKN